MVTVISFTGYEPKERASTAKRLAADEIAKVPSGTDLHF
jgi:hypothetical protein